MNERIMQIYKRLNEITHVLNKELTHEMRISYKKEKNELYVELARLKGQEKQ